MSGKVISLDCILDQVYVVIMESAICITKPFCRETLKFLWDGFCWNPCWNRCEHRDGEVSESKWEPFYWDINHQSSVIPEQRWKVLSILLKLWTNGSGSEEQHVIMSDLFLKCFKMFSQFLKCFHSELICSVAITMKTMTWKDFLAQNFRLGCLSDFRKLPQICVASSNTPMEEFIF